MSDLWAGVILGVIFSIPIGLGVNLLSSYIQRKLRSRNADVQVRNVQLRSEEIQFAQYLAANPAIAAIVWANYQAKLLRFLLRSTLLSVIISGLVCLTLLLKAYGKLEAGPERGLWTMSGTFFFILIAGIYSKVRVIGRARRIAQNIDLTFPISSDLSDNRWRHFR